MREGSRHLLRVPALLLLVAAIGFVCSLVQTRSHVGTTRDSNQYIGTAANLRDGKGFTMPFSRPTAPLDPRRGVELYGRIPYTDQPPLYPVALAAVRSVTPSFDAAARAIGALSFGLALLFVGVIAWYATENILLAIATQAALLLGPVHPFPFAPRWSWLSLSGLILSESLASAFAYGALVCVAVMLVTRNRAAFAGAVVLSTLAVTTRWAAIALAISGVATVLLWRRWPWRRRLAHAAVLGGVPVAVAIALNQWNRARFGEQLRPFRFHPGGWVDLTFLRLVVADWFAPSSWPGPLQAVVIAVVLACCGYSLRRAVHVLRDDDASEFDNAMAVARVLLAFFAVTAIGVVVASRWFIDRGVVFDARQFGPAQPALYALFFAGVADMPFWRRVRVPALVAAVVAAVVIMLLGIVPAVRNVRDGTSSPSAAGDISANGALAGALRLLPRTELVFATRADAVFQVAQRPALLLPVTRFGTIDTRNTAFEREICELGDILQGGKGVIVSTPDLFDPVATDAQLRSQLELHTVVTTPEGTISTVTRGCTSPR